MLNARNFSNIRSDCKNLGLTATSLSVFVKREVEGGRKDHELLIFTSKHSSLQFIQPFSLWGEEQFCKLLKTLIKILWI